MLQLTVAIQNTNFEFVEHGQPLNDEVLRKFLQRLKVKAEMSRLKPFKGRVTTDERQFEFEREVIEMLLVIKQLVLAPSFFINERQRQAIRQKLGAFDKTRRDLTFMERRDKRIDSVSPAGQKRETSAARKKETLEYTNRLYKTHKESAEYKSKLKDWYGK